MKRSELILLKGKERRKEKNTDEIDISGLVLFRVY